MSALPDDLGIPEPPVEPCNGAKADSKANREVDAWDNLDKISRAKKETTLVVHKVLSWIIPVAIALAFLLFVIVLGVYVTHLIIPAERRWLPDEELRHIHSMLFSGVVGGAVAVAARAYFLDKD